VASQLQRDIINYMNATRGSQFIYQELPASLGYRRSAKPDLICQLIEKKCRHADQKSGNCWWVSLKSAPLGVLLGMELMEVQATPYKTQAERQKAYTKIIDSTQALYKYYSTFLRLEILKEYLQRPPDQIGRDHDLVRQVVHKLYLKNSRYLFDEKGVVAKAYSFLASLAGIKTDQSLLYPYKKEEIEGWIEDYRQKFKLPEDYFYDPLMYIGR
jgi:hypothetical protein